jgi:Flp pilus assembly pilin Flp
MTTVTERVGQGGHVTRADIESKLRQLRGEVDEIGASSKNYVLIAGAVAAVTIIGFAYVLGKRKGKRKTTVVEVRRV